MVPLLYTGEIYDARKEARRAGAAAPAWDAAPLAVYPAGTWSAAVPMHPKAREHSIA